MKIPFPVEEANLSRTLQNAYGITIHTMRFIPIGDSAYSYQVKTKNEKCFYLKLFDITNEKQRHSVENLSFSLHLTSTLYHEGIFQNLTYPIPNVNGQFITEATGCRLVLFNFIEGTTLADAYPFSNIILSKIADSLATIHQAIKTIHIAEPLIERYDISFTKTLTNKLALIHVKTFDNPYHNKLQQILIKEHDKVLETIKLLNSLHHYVTSTTKEPVLCHGDVWGGNLIIDQDETLYFLDWEGAILAPPERDLFNYVNTTFLHTYMKALRKPMNIDMNFIRYYAYQHHLRNLTNWILNILERNNHPLQNKNDLEMIVYHCLDRFEGIEQAITHLQWPE